MKEVQTEKDMLELMERVVNRVLPAIVRNNVSTLQEGIIKSVNLDTGTASVQLLGTNTSADNLKVYRGAGTYYEGDRCLLATIDPNNKTKLYIVAIY